MVVLILGYALEIGLRWLPKLGVDMSPHPHAHRRACTVKAVYTKISKNFVCIFVDMFIFMR